MLRFVMVISMLIGLSATAKNGKGTVCTQPYSEPIELLMEAYELEAKLFGGLEEAENDLTALRVVQEEEDVEIGFNTSAYLPEGFNPLKGKNTIDWEAVGLVELEEEVELGFDPYDYLPVGFDPFEGMAYDYYRISSR